MGCKSNLEEQEEELQPDIGQAKEIWILDRIVIWESISGLTLPSSLVDKEGGWEAHADLQGSYNKILLAFSFAFLF